MTRSLMCASLLASLVLCTSMEAFAASATGNYSGITKVRKGVFDLGMDSLLILRSTSTPTEVDGEEVGSTSQLGLSFAGGPALRYFVIDNLSVGADLHFLYIKNSSSVEDQSGNTSDFGSSDSAFLGFLTGHYFVRLGSGLFFKPGLGVGGFYGSRSIPDPLDSARSLNGSLSGGAGKADLGFAFYANSHFNLRAGLNLVYYLGSVSSDSAQGTSIEGSFSTMEAGFSVGLGYSF